ncbi:hypothetical protein BTR25_13380 [Bacillus sp. MRMR6]|nr:hypothetical protein BTR25_13380 [Bacillus sp. MRMR6]
MEQTVAYNKYDIYEMIDNYKDMINIIRHYEDNLEGVDFKGVAQYGVEASLPSGKGLVSKALENEVVRRNERFKRISDYTNKVNYINTKRKKLTDHKEIEILDCLLDGLSLSAISRAMRLSRQQIDKIRSDIVDKLVTDNTF